MRMAAGVLTTLVAVSILITQPGFVASLDGRIFDAMATHAGPGIPTGRVVIVDLDEKSLAQVGRWPWPRDRLALLVKKIVGQGAAAVALDMMFPEPDGTIPGGGSGADERTNDRILASSLAGGRVVIGYHFGFGSDAAGSESCVLRPAPLAVAGADDTRGESFFQASSVLCSLPGIARAAAGAGFLNAAPDNDGGLRRVPLLIEYKGLVYPSLALAAVLLERRPETIVLSGGELRIGRLTVPVDRRSTMLLRFRGPAGTLRHISAADVLSDRVPAGTLGNRLVLVGGSAIGLQDTVAARVDPMLAGVEVQATAVDNLLKGDPFSRPGWGSAIELVFVLLAGLAATFLVIRAPPVWGAAVAVALATGFWFAAAAVLSRTGIFLSPLMPTAALLGNLTIITVMNSVAERKQRERADLQIAASKNFILSALTSFTSIRDSETGDHIVRIQEYLRILCRKLASQPRFQSFLTPGTIDLLIQLAPIHDVGKVGVPDGILRKPGKLTSAEFEAIKQHVEYGRKVLDDARVQSGIQDEALFRIAFELVYTHHERWDGTGYPKGLRGDDIPIPGRLLAVADVYDALVSKRVYKDPISHTEAVQLIASGRGTQFDPEIVDAFLDVQESWLRVAEGTWTIAKTARSAGGA